MMYIPQKRSLYKQKASTLVDSLLFFVVFLAGSLGVYWMKLVGFDQVAVTVFPCSLLFVYAALVSWAPLFRLREDQGGDNCYYLGFLYTLVSLALALRSFTRASVTEKIVEDFGIALATTIIGIALRIALNQMRRDPVEVEREARLELAAAAQRLRAELDQSVLEMNAFRRASQQSIAEGLATLSERIEAAFTDTLARYEKITSGPAAQIEQALAAFAKSANRLNTLTERTSEAVTILSQRLGDLAAGNVLGQLESQVAALTAALKELDQVGATLDSLCQHLLGLGQRLQDTMTALAADEVGLHQSLRSEVQRLEEILREAGRAIAGIGGELHANLVLPAQEAHGALWAIANQQDGLRGVEEQLKRLPAAIKEQVDALTELGLAPGHRRRFLGFLWRR